MFVLQLNDMRSSRIEILDPVAKAETEEELINFMKNEGVESYRDGRWGKSFRQDGPLEWFNAPLGISEFILDVGTADDWADQARERYGEQIGPIPTVK